MGFLGRKLLYSDSINETISQLKELCEPSCDQSNDLGYCEPPCLIFCSITCPLRLPPPPPPTYPNYHHPNKALITTLLVLSIVFVLACFIAAYIKFHSRRTTRTVPSNEETHDEFIDEDQFQAVVDHPIWYIRTIGLQPSVISAITVCKYVKAEGLVEGTECSVCLSEFEENETLRLLPKCSHAFHIPCIDTWLRSHTNCPLCRAPILSNSVATASSSSSSIGEESNEIVAADSGEQSRRDMGSGIGEEAESQGRIVCEDGIQKLRRSVSLDFVSALKISQAVCNVLPVNSDENSSERRVRRDDEINIEISSNRVVGNQRLSRFMASSSFRGSSRTGTSNSLKRSVSCGGKLFMSRYSRNQNTAFPL